MEGNHVKPGDKLGLVECMKIPNDVVSLAKGKVSKILVQDGQTVEYGQPLFSIVENGNGEES
jgi:acetyl-CoA carboxylase biotin carboxyl carrier protein